ncbi:MAG: hypothetical protein RPU59_11240 [Candidatus Sedimenticola sp. (ex Thyasira tokunagai)]
MIRRIYILFPKASQAEKAVDELKGIGIDISQMHAVARPDIDLTDLPKASFRQQSDFGAKIESLLWNLNLGLFFLMIGLSVITAFEGAWMIFLLCLAVMSVSFAAGSYFASYIPHSHLKEFHSALGHGEVLLLVDVPRWRLRDIDKEIRKRHPEASCDAVGWTSPTLQT